MASQETGKAAALTNVLNFRDVGSFVNNCNAGSAPKLKPQRLFRSARPDEASSADKNFVANVVGIKTIIDLRSDTEHIMAAKKHQQADKVSTPTSRDPAAGVPKIPGLKYEEINLNGKGFERSLVWRLKYISLARLIYNMALGYRTEGIAILGREVMQPRGLIGLGRDTLDYCGPEVKKVFDVLSDETAYPVLVHCTQGKDRTGITVMLALMLCDVSIDAISSDYVLSESELEPEKEERMKEIRSIGLDESFARCPPDFCPQIKEYLGAKYGGVREYMAGIGVSPEQQEQIRSILLA
ncbi:uncharacterized protein AB675_788 [Cyphellophora attinorum]|uniref:Tyrosine specific protein phosphatases domain-containing protein n=1 Tax=Cyphellophora attinorum TaxID=1664694 RepID=A0A0N1HHK9_9EURO|nr:uncharacterized protein AB675_788 [Phialophora attinorum]KPI45524.1 hypothetical protein AB675_788 [Phialophora attinorum]